MKRIITAITVIAIATSALAFKNKKGGTYCLATTSGGTCSVRSGITQTDNGTAGFVRYKYLCWDTTQSGCDNAGSNCNTQTTFYNE